MSNSTKQWHQAIGLCVDCTNVRHPKSKARCATCLIKVRLGVRKLQGCRRHGSSGRGRKPILAAGV